ncbi:hypothetical protein, partial [Staphylococcus aureus]|uniref:hypothetical protein n=1 Tax=Staphylococcus aureus TaxID=1280 RepID=UPI00338FDF40
RTVAASTRCLAKLCGSFIALWPSGDNAPTRLIMKLSYLANALYVLAVLFLAFVAGIAVSLTEVWPYPVFHDAYKAA